MTLELDKEYKDILGKHFTTNKISDAVDIIINYCKDFCNLNYIPYDNLKSLVISQINDLDYDINISKKNLQ